MQKCEPKFNAWLKDKGVSGGDDSKKYLLYDKSGRRKMINHAELEAFCRKYFDAFCEAAKDKLLRGELLGTEKGHFRLEVLDKDVNVVKSKRGKKNIRNESW